MAAEEGGNTTIGVGSLLSDEVGSAEKCNRCDFCRLNSEWGCRATDEIMGDEVEKLAE